MFQLKAMCHQCGRVELSGHSNSSASLHPTRYLAAFESCPILIWKCGPITARATAAPKERCYLVAAVSTNFQ